MDVPRKLAIVEFEHGCGCTTGQPYGGCGSACAWKVVKFVSGPLTTAELAAHGVAAKTIRF